MTVFSDTWNAAFEALPADNEILSSGAGRIRDHKNAVSERLEVDHSWAGDASDGEHKKVTLTVQASAPTQVADKGIMYTKDVNSKAELFWIDEDGNELQITSAGSLFGAVTLGEMKMWHSPTPPSGYLICDGQAVSRTTYSDLFGIVSTVFGVGDGSTTFNLPDLRGRTPVGANDAGLPNGEDSGLTTRNEAAEGGAETHALSEAELATHKHVVFKSSVGGTAIATSADVMAFVGTYGSVSDYTIASTTGTPDLGATGNIGSGTAHANMQPFTVVGFIIYAGAQAA